MPFDTTGVAALHRGDAAETMRGMRPGSVDAIITSPPYVQQRHFQYGGVAKRDDPEWTAAWMEAARPLLKPGGSVAIVIRADWPRRARRALGDRDRPQAEHIALVRQRVMKVANDANPDPARRPRNAA